MTKMIEVKIMRDIWTGDPAKEEVKRIRKGTVVEVDPTDDAVIAGLQNGAIMTLSEPEKVERSKAKAKG